MQLIIHFLQTHIIDINPNNILEHDGISIKNSISACSGVPSEYISMSMNGKSFYNEDNLYKNEFTSNNINNSTTTMPMVIRCSLAGGLPGGKGGFGAALRAAAKQKGPKRTTDFGACRDLSGKRLRQVNDEIVLQKWKDAQDNGEKYDTEGSTPSGINMWYLKTPNWTDPFKESYRKKYMKNRTKTSICRDWGIARENNRRVPVDAPTHWGCPRGARCEYAHGAGELQGNAGVTMEQEKLLALEVEESNKRNAYINSSMSGDGYSDGSGAREMSDAVAIGLGLQSQSEAGSGSGSGSNKRRKLSYEDQNSSVGSSGGVSVGTIAVKKLEPIPVNISQYVTTVIVTNPEDNANTNTNSDGINDNANNNGDIGVTSGSFANVDVNGVNGVVCKPMNNTKDNVYSYQTECNAGAATNTTTSTSNTNTANIDSVTGIGSDIGMIHAVGTGFCLDFESICNNPNNTYTTSTNNTNSTNTNNTPPVIVDPSLCRSVYYEVDLKSSGLMQVGWGTAECSVMQRLNGGIIGSGSNGGNSTVSSEMDSGIGDDCYSFGYDGWRQRKWHGGNTTGTTTGTSGDGLGEVYGEGITWGAGDTVGCLLSYQHYTIHTNNTKTNSSANTNSNTNNDSNNNSNVIHTAAMCIRYTLNKIDLGVAFTIPDVRTLCSNSNSSNNQSTIYPKLYPAISLEFSESCQLNAGQMLSTFQYDRQGVLDSLGEVQSYLESVIKSSSNSNSNSSVDCVDGSDGSDGSDKTGGKMKNKTGKSKVTSTKTNTSITPTNTGTGATTTITVVDRQDMELVTAWSLRYDNTSGTSGTGSKTISNSNPDPDPIIYPPIADFDTDTSNTIYPTSQSLEQFGMSHLKYELQSRHLKCGGTTCSTFIYN